MITRGATSSYPVSGSHTSVECGGDEGGVWVPQNPGVGVPQNPGVEAPQNPGAEVPQNPGLECHKTKPLISHIRRLPDFSAAQLQYRGYTQMLGSGLYEENWKKKHMLLNLL